MKTSTSLSLTIIFIPFQIQSSDVYSNAYIEITGVNAISGGDVSILYSKLEARKSSQSGEIEYYRY